MGGNHDRWGGTFWTDEMGATFHPSAMELSIAGRRTFLAHGDGLAESRAASRFMHRITSHPVTTALFRIIHPDVGFWLADRLSGSLAEQTREGAALDRAAAAQEAFAAGLMSRRGDLDLVILGHTHRPVVRETGPGRWYLNPGAFMEGGCYAVVDAAGPPVLHRFS
jgi:UDP-2,3-diacylglucosamine hydrolase